MHISATGTCSSDVAHFAVEGASVISMLVKHTSSIRHWRAPSLCANLKRSLALATNRATQGNAVYVPGGVPVSV